MKAKVIRTQAGKYEVKYNVAECFLGWAVREWRAPARCCYCMLKDGFVARFDTLEEARKFASQLPECPGLLTCARIDNTMNNFISLSENPLQ